MSTVKATRAVDITDTQKLTVGEMGMNGNPEPEPEPETDADSDSSSSSSSSSSSESDNADPENGVLPGDLIVATDTFTFDIADAPTDLFGLSIASSW
jgi:hypothetical protein